jgi:hypothetical protein
MAVITGIQYSTLATKYGNMMKVLKTAATYMYDALTVIAQYNEVDPTRDLIVAFDDVYQSQSVILKSGTQFVAVARALNNHVLNRARTDSGSSYTNVADWMTDEELDGHAVGFPQEWADLSKLAGQDVDDFVV